MNSYDKFTGKISSHCDGFRIIANGSSSTSSVTVVRANDKTSDSLQIRVVYDVEDYDKCDDGKHNKNSGYKRKKTREEYYKNRK